jgi:hypothetical protein
LASCTTNEIIEEVAGLETDRLINCWTHAMEEDSGDGTQIFRPCDSQEFPLSRFRMTMTLRPDGTAEYLELSPVNAHQLVEGRWAFDESQREFQLLNDKEENVLRATLEDLQNDRIALRRN